MVDIEHARRLARVSLLCACALVLSYLETMIPLPVAVPGIKLGLANVAVVVALYTLDAKSAGAVALVKVFASGFLFGSPMMLAYSLGGTVLAFIGMVALAAVPGVGLVPVSMLAAVLHNVGQLGVAAMAPQTPAVFINLGVLGVAACVTGGITGAVAEGALAGIEQADDTRPSVDCAALAANIVAGERIAFVGTNGSGKSTCALELAGLLKDVNGHAMCVQGTVALLFRIPITRSSLQLCEMTSPLDSKTAVSPATKCVQKSCRHSTSLALSSLSNAMSPRSRAAKNNAWRRRDWLRSPLRS